MMDKHRTFGYLDNGGAVIEIASYDEKYFDQCAMVLQSFYDNASICMGLEINLNQNEEVRAELTSLCKVMARDGVSLMARDVELDKIIGVAFNKIQIKGKPSDEPSEYFMFRRRNTNSDHGKMLLKMMMDMDQSVDCYKYFDTDCIFDLSFLCTIPGYERRSVGRMLTTFSVELARELKNGQSLSLLTEHLRGHLPGAITAVFSSNFSQKIGFKLGFEALSQSFFADYHFNGKPLSERITGGHETMILAGLKL